MHGSQLKNELAKVKRSLSLSQFCNVFKAKIQVVTVMPLIRLDGMNNDRANKEQEQQTERQTERRSI